MIDPILTWSATNATPDGITFMLSQPEHVTALTAAIRRYEAALEDVGHLGDDQLEVFADRAAAATLGMRAGVSERWTADQLYAVAATVHSLLRFVEMFPVWSTDAVLEDIDPVDLRHVDAALQTALRLVAAERLAEQRRIERIGGAV